jgi:hypothetical protein
VGVHHDALSVQPLSAVEDLILQQRTFDPGGGRLT